MSETKTTKVIPLTMDERMNNLEESQVEILRLLTKKKNSKKKGGYKPKKAKKGKGKGANIPKIIRNWVYNNIPPKADNLPEALEDYVEILNELAQDWQDFKENSRHVGRRSMNSVKREFLAYYRMEIMHYDAIIKDNLSYDPTQYS